MSVYDIFGLLRAGATVVLPTIGHEYDVEHWADLTVQMRSVSCKFCRCPTFRWKAIRQMLGFPGLPRP